MSESWPEQYVAALQARARVELDVEAMGPAAMARLLDLARVVAHGSERKNAPLATYIAGNYVAMRVAQGCDASTALAEAEAVAAELDG